MKAFVLKPLSPFHIQSNSANHESVENFVKSDTLSAALMHIWNVILGEISGLPNKLPFTVSSMFPAVQTEDTCIKLFPKNKRLDFNWYRDNAKKGSSEPNHKEWKRVLWLDETLFKKSIEQIGSLRNYLPNQFDGPIWFSNEAAQSIQTLYKIDKRTRVVLDRVSSAATPFHFITVNYTSSTRLFFLAEIEKEYETQFETVLRFLGDEGIGGDKTLGMGRFEVQAIEDYELPKVQNPNAYMCLGLYNPTTDEQKAINWESSIYSIINRRGWVSKIPLRRRASRMLDDASILKSADRLYGRLLDVLNPNDSSLPEEVLLKLNESGLDHPIYRDGRTILIPMSI